MIELIYENPWVSVFVAFGVVFLCMLTIIYFDKPRNNPPEV